MNGFWSSLPLWLLGLSFALAAAAVWAAGITLSNTTTVLDKQFKLSAALGGLILLAVATNLPEIAITLSAALQHNLDLAIGNILGGIAVQTLVLAALDAFGLGRRAALTATSGSLTPVLEGTLVIAILMGVVMGAQLPGTAVLGRLELGSVLVALIWAVGLWGIGRASKLPWHLDGPPSKAPAQPAKQGQQGGAPMSTRRAALGFAFAALVTLGAGWVLALSGGALAQHFQLSGVLFGATVLAVVTSLPELSTGLAAVRQGKIELALGDIFGGNAFLPVLFLAASLISGQAVLVQLQPTDLYLTALGALLTAVYVFGLVLRRTRQWGRMGVDSWTVVGLYLIGVGGLWLISRSGG